MGKVLIAYNDDVSENSRQFFDDCATDIRNYCIGKSFDYDLLAPPNLTEVQFMDKAQDSKICYVASHGRPDSVVNEEEEEFVSTRTTNYNLNGKCFFAVSCFCAQNLKDELLRIGLKLFVGYRDRYTEFPGYDEFTQSANYGLKVFIDGQNVAQMKNSIYAEYDRLFDVLNEKSALAADALLDNKESLVIEGDDNLTIANLT